MSEKPSPGAVALAGKILAVIGKRDPLEAMHALLICVQTVEFVANPANDLTATMTKP